MNIFYTNTDPYLAADEHCNVHQVKMILEYAQLLSTAHHVTGSGTADMYKPTHVNHPGAVWVRSSVNHYDWVLSCWLHLLNSFVGRTGKRHKSADMIPELLWFPELPGDDFTPPPQCMPDHHRQSDPCLAYQSYLNEKFQEWIDRPRPMRVEFMHGEPEWLNVNRRSNSV